MSAPGEAQRVRRRVVVHGRVQGVFFRDTTAQEAVRAGVAGWVRNRHEGTVEAVFEGEPNAVAALVRFCHRGPRSARVLAVDEFEEPPEGLGSFEIRHPG